MRSSSAATSLISVTVCALVSAPSSEANTINRTRPSSRWNSLRTACSSCAERKLMGRLYAAERRGGRRPVHDLENAAAGLIVDPRLDQGGPVHREDGVERAQQPGLVHRREGRETERRTQGRQIQTV